MDQGLKRKANSDAARGPKQKKIKKLWRVPRKRDQHTPQRRTIQPGDSGIWATCDKGREGKCIGELRDLFTEHATTQYGDNTIGNAMDGATEIDDPEASIENEIHAEIEDMHDSSVTQLFTPVRVDVQCVVFMKTAEPVEPVNFVKKICEDALNHSLRKRTRFVKRLTPMTLMGRATEDGLEKVAREVLAPHFHQEPFQSRKFAIRPSLRNHNILSRDGIIKKVASIVGPGHTVDLKNYELLVLIEVYQNVCGVSVVDSSYEALRRYNLAEIFDPQPKGELDTKAATTPPTERMNES